MKDTFSEGFCKDISDLLELCKENKTDSIALKLPIEDTKLKLVIDMTFSVEKNE